MHHSRTEAASRGQPAQCCGRSAHAGAQTPSVAIRPEVSTRRGAWASGALLFCWLTALGAWLGRTAEFEFLSDRSELIVSATQDWGLLGLDVAAHTADKPGLPLQIGETVHAKGLGHHANGTLHVLLDGDFTSFAAEVGLQPCGGGSVVFRVRVDGEVRFDSGVMRSGDPAKPVQVAVAGVQELVLEAKDAGDGISCDMANWANARLLRADRLGTRREEPGVDMAPFGLVVTWDPNRMDGTRASRIEEFPAADLFLETDLVPDAQDGFHVPIGTNHTGCIGLQWLNRRAIRELRLEFVDPATMPATNQVRVEGWFGESAWQGNWQPLAGEFAVEGNRLVFRASAKAPSGGLLLTRKVRWVWPARAERILVKHPNAFTRSRWVTTTLRVEAEKGPADDFREIGLENGAWINPAGTWVAGDRFGNVGCMQLKPGTSTWLTVRCSRPSPFKSDSTFLLIRLNGAAAAVGVEDVLAHDCVYLPELGVLLSRADAPIKLADYKKRIAGRQTILEQVRVLPDQTLEQAMAKTHHEAQREGPVMLSLACDNHKFVVERDGTVRFQTGTVTNSDWFASAGELRPHFGTGETSGLTRKLDGGWLPIPVIEVATNGLVWGQRSFVAPTDAPGADPARLNRPSVCVVEFTVTNTLDTAAEASLALDFLVDSQRKTRGQLTRCAGGYFLLNGAAVIGWALTDAASPLVAEPKAGGLSVHGSLPAHGQAAFAVLVPAPGVNPTGVPEPARLRADTEAYWNAVLAAAAQIETPKPFLNDLIRSSQVRCLIAARNEANGERIAPWIAAMSYGPLESEAHSVIRGMDFLGHTEFAQRGLDYFIHRYHTNGFLTTGYTTFGTAWHLWTLGEHYQLTHDRAWLEGISPEIKRVGRWIMRQREKTERVVPARPDRYKVREHRLMPPGVMADWNAFAYHFCLNAYYAAGLRGIGDALSDLGDPEGQVLRKEGERLARFTASAYEETARASPVVPLRNGTWVPYYPSQLHSPGKLAEFFPGEDAGRSWCYDVELGAHQLVPTGVLKANDRRVTWMLDHMEDVQFLADGWFDYPAAQNAQDWFNLGGFSKVQPYYTRNCEIYALRDDVKPFVRSYFNTLAAMANPEVLTFWEHFNHSGAWDKTHETGYFLHQTRTMLVTERGRELWLAPLITSNWLKDGMTVAVSNAPTQFGKVSYRLTSHVAQQRIEAAIDPPMNERLDQLVLRVRHPEGKRIRSVTVNGRAHREFDRQGNTVTLPANRGRLAVEVRFP